MGAAHTEGRLVVSPYDGFGPLTTIRAGDPKTGARIASTFEATSPQHIERNEANARRLVACWNACERIRTEMLETIAGLMPATVPYHQLHAQRDELLAALRNASSLIGLLHANCSDRVDLTQDPRPALISAAIAKAAGSAA